MKIIIENNLIIEELNLKRIESKINKNAEDIPECIDYVIEVDNQMILGYRENDTFHIEELHIFDKKVVLKWNQKFSGFFYIKNIWKTYNIIKWIIKKEGM